RVETIAGSNSGELENLRGLKRSRAENDLPVCAELLRRSIYGTRDADCSAAIENDWGNDSACGDCQICPLSNRREERSGGAEALAVPDRRLKVTDALLVYS